MAENNQNQVGVVGQQGAQQGQPQGQPQRGVPGVQQPPVPSPAEVKRLVAEQQAALRQQMQESQRRAQELQKRMKEGQQVVGMELPQQGQQPQGQPFAQVPVAQIPASQAQQYDPPSPVPGMTAEQVLAGPTRSQPTQPTGPSNQFAQYSEPQPVKKDVVMWHPMRGSGVPVELTDCIIKGVPERGIMAENDPQARVVLALFSEVLALRQYIAGMAQTPQVPPDLMQRVVRLEQTLFEQRQSLSARARGIREQIEIFQMKGMTAEQIIANLQGQAVAAEQMTEDGSDDLSDEG